MSDALDHIVALRALSLRISRRSRRPELGGRRVRGSAVRYARLRRRGFESADTALATAPDRESVPG